MVARTTVRLLTRAQAAAHLRVTLDELDRLRRAGAGPEWGQWRATIRYDFDGLNAWLQATGGLPGRELQSDHNQVPDITKRVRMARPPG